MVKKSDIIDLHFVEVSHDLKDEQNGRVTPSYRNNLCRFYIYFRWQCFQNFTQSTVETYKIDKLSNRRAGKSLSDTIFRRFKNAAGKMHH